MKRSKKIAIFAGLLVAVNVSTFLILAHNQRAGFYRPDADIIVIPIFNTVWLSFLVIPFLAVVTFVPDSAVVNKLTAQKHIYRALSSFVLAILYLPCAVVPLFGVAYWFCPHHYLLSAILAVVFMGLITCMVVDIRRLFSNRRLHWIAEKAGSH